ncbi:Flagellar hook-length control protein FliK [hydrothermal vent metagenome]|uniref:Flagellar hook-length control protein FliK n=1 Tax=hydrothermal vent metagenome TaxID=652676 RepID=A0A3B0RR49_9ZZZZ
MDAALNIGAQLGGFPQKDIKSETGVVAPGRQIEGYEGAPKRDGEAKEFLAAVLDQSAAVKDETTENTFISDDAETRLFKLQFQSLATQKTGVAESESGPPQPEVSTLFTIGEPGGVESKLSGQALAPVVLGVAADQPDALKTGPSTEATISGGKTEQSGLSLGAFQSVVIDDTGLESTGPQSSASAPPVSDDDKSKLSKPQPSTSVALTVGDAETMAYGPQPNITASTALDDTQNGALVFAGNSQAERLQNSELIVTSRAVTDDPIKPRRQAQPGAKAAIVQGAEISPLQKAQQTLLDGAQQLAPPDAERAVTEDIRIPEKQTQPSATLNDPSRVVQSRPTSPYLLAPANHTSSSVVIANNGEGVSSDLDLDMAVDFTSGRRLVGQAASVPQTLASPTTAHAPAIAATAQVIAAIKANRRSDTIEIRLDPPELGRVKIDFTMETMDSVKAILSAERAETLDHMRRNIGDLAAQLKDAGFKSMEFEFAKNSGQEFSKTNAASETPGKDGGDLPSLGQGDIVYLSMRSDAQLDLLA